MNTEKKFLYLLVPCMALFLFGCGTPDIEPMPDGLAENVNKLGSGPAKGETKETNIQPNAAGSNMGDATAENVNVKGATMNRVNTASGHLQTGFSFAASMKGLQAALQEASDASPTMRALTALLDRQLAADAPDEVAINATIDKIRAEEKLLRETIAKAGGDLSNLTSLTQVFTMVSSNGADNPMSDAQANAIAGSIAPTVDAARNNPKTPPATGDGN